ncbi:esterase [Atractiella rhizophila]|nr:esterase [Atractiella rhizophila]
MQFLSFLLSFAVWSQALAVPLAPRALPPPASDPFYRPPAGFESAALGAIFKTRSVNVAVLGLVPQNVTAWQLLYRTESHNGTAMATVTTVFKPKTSDLKPNLVAYNTAQDATGSICAPSYAFQSGNNQIPSIVSFEFLLLEGFLNQGWTVVSSDYEGPNNAFAAGRLSGKGVLDGIRAALNFAELGLAADTKIGISGYSGGAIASGWAGALQPTYAPELNIIGISQGEEDHFRQLHGTYTEQGGTPANVAGTLANLDGGLFAGLGVAGITGLMNAYQPLNDLLHSIATTFGKGAIDFSNNHCVVADLLAFPFQTAQSPIWTTAGKNLLSLPQVKAVTTENTLGLVKSETPQAPTYVYHALHDEVIPVGDVETMVKSYCANGAPSLLYERNVGLAEHAGLFILGAPKVQNFFIDRFKGVPFVSGCQITNTTTSETLSDPKVIGTGLELIWQTLLDLLGRQIGSDDSNFKGSVASNSSSTKLLF